MDPITISLIAGGAMQLMGSIGESKSAKSQAKLMRGQMKINELTAEINKSHLNIQKNQAIKSQFKQLEAIGKKSEEMYARNMAVVASSGQKKGSSVHAQAINMPKTDYYSNAQQVMDNVETIKQNAILGEMNIDIQTANQNSQLASGIAQAGAQANNSMISTIGNLSLMYATNKAK